MRSKILLFSVILGIGVYQSAYAGVVPGTIQTSKVSGSISCNSSSNYYAPTYAYCDNNTKTAKAYSWDYLYDYSDKTGKGGYYAPGGGYTAIDSSQTCDWSSKGSYHTPHTDKTQYCTFGSGTGTTTDSIDYLGGGSDGSCSFKTGTDNLISSYNQIGNVSRTTGASSGSCKVEGRYATTDNEAPVVTPNVVGNVFLNNDTVWCNIEKYRSSGYDKKLHPGCAEYAKQNSSVSGNEDLLKGLELIVNNDPSGIWKVEIQIGSCSTSYISLVTNEGILQSTTSASGVKPQYTNGFTIKYNQDFIAFGENQPSLLSKFGKTRIDECFGNGKNNLVVTTYDMSRGSDGVSLAGNSKKFITSGIFIDNNTSIIEKKLDLDTYESTTTNKWVNFSLEGNIQIGEDVNKKSSGECTLLTSTGSCGSPSSGKVWVSPLGVNPTTGIFTQYSCDGLIFPNVSECVEKPLPSVPKVCTGMLPSGAIQSNTGGLLIDTPWQSTDSTSNCYYEVPTNYCEAGGLVPCIVKPGGGVVVVDPVTVGSCGSSDQKEFSSQPTTGLCDAGGLKNMSGSGPWSWTCEGANGGSDAYCSAKIIANTCDYVPTITGGGGKFGGGGGNKCYNNAANNGGGVNSKYTCDTDGKLYYDGTPNVIGAFKYLGADKENCFVSCEKPSSCGSEPKCIINADQSIYPLNLNVGENHTIPANIVEKGGDDCTGINGATCSCTSPSNCVNPDNHTWSCQNGASTLSWGSEIFVKSTISYPQESDFVISVCPHLNSSNWTTFLNCPYSRETTKTGVCSIQGEVYYNYIGKSEPSGEESYDIYKSTCG